MTTAALKHAQALVKILGMQGTNPLGPCSAVKRSCVGQVGHRAHDVHYCDSCLIYVLACRVRDMLLMNA